MKIRKRTKGILGVLVGLLLMAEIVAEPFAMEPSQPTAPSICQVEVDGLEEGQWSREDVRLFIEVESLQACRVLVYENQDMEEPVAEGEWNEEEERYQVVMECEEGEILNQCYFIVAIDEEENLSEPWLQWVKIDKAIPELTIELGEADYVVQEEEEIPCYKGDCVISVTGEEGKEESGIRSITAAVNEKIVYEQFYQEKDKKAEFEISTDAEGVHINEDGSYIVLVQIEDGAGNVYEERRKLYKDDEPPVIETLRKTPEEKWSREQVQVLIENLEDTKGEKNAYQSGIQQIRYGTQKDWGMAREVNQGKDGYSFSVDEEGAQTYYVWAMDRVGNVSRAKEIAVNIDWTPPEITGFSFASEGNHIGDGQIFSRVESLPYGYYFKENTRVIIQAEDGEPSCGLKKIHYYFTDAQGEIQDQGEKKVSKGGFIYVDVPTDFKGQIWAMGEDQLGNQGEYVHSEGVVIESRASHEAASQVEIILPETAAATEGNLALYREEVEVAFSLEDFHSGIRRVEWQIEYGQASEGNTGGSLEVDGQGEISGDNGGWQTKSNGNQVVELSSGQRITRENNEITITLRMTDWAGYVTTRTEKLALDTTAPQVELTFDHSRWNKKYEGENQYFKEKRTAVIKVTDLNQNPDNIRVEIKRKYDSRIPEYTWEKTGADVYETKIEFQEDDTYDLGIEVKDRAGNQAQPVVADPFVLDQTPPVIQLKYDDQGSSHGIYYSKARTAVLMIAERNFDSEQVEVREKEGAMTMGAWSEEEGGWINKLTFGQDGGYQYVISCEDKAGNRGVIYEEERFVVDQTPPVLEIKEVEDQSANQGEVQPVVTWSDENLDQQPRITLLGANRGEVNVEGVREGTLKKGSLVIADFPRDREVDDLYHLTGEITDMAGNRTTASISFSVNRFGSVYTLEETTRDILGRYLPQPRQIEIMETNVDTLNVGELVVKVTRNGITRELKAGSEYQIHKREKEGEWSQYQYRIPKEIFEGEGQYLVSIRSRDRAGNSNENDQEMIYFGVDKTRPEITAINAKSNEFYDQEEREVWLDVVDNLILEEVEIFLNGKAVRAENEDSRYILRVKERAEPQNITIKASDAAGNSSSLQIENFKVKRKTVIAGEKKGDQKWFLFPLVLLVVVMGGIIGYYSSRK